MTDLNKHEKIILEVVDTFTKMCDHFEENDPLGCGGCPVAEDCLIKDKHKGLAELILDLEIEW